MGTICPSFVMLQSGKPDILDDVLIFLLFIDLLNDVFEIIIITCDNLFDNSKFIIIVFFDIGVPTDKSTDNFNFLFTGKIPTLPTSYPPTLILL